MTEVVAALIWDKEKFMICQRPTHKARGLLWEFVGGKVELGESKEQALIRECQEELADLLEAMWAVVRTRGWTLDELEQVRADKAAERGGFAKKILLKEVWECAQKQYRKWSQKKLKLFIVSLTNWKNCFPGGTIRQMDI